MKSAAAAAAERETAATSLSRSPSCSCASSSCCSSSPPLPLQLALGSMAAPVPPIDALRISDEANAAANRERVEELHHCALNDVQRMLPPLLPSTSPYIESMMEEEGTDSEVSALKCGESEVFSQMSRGGRGDGNSGGGGGLLRRPADARGARPSNSHQHPRRRRMLVRLAAAVAFLGCLFIGWKWWSSGNSLPHSDGGATILSPPPLVGDRHNFPWTGACTPSGPFRTPAEQQAHFKRRVDQLLSYGTRVAGSMSSGYRRAHAMLTAMAHCEAELPGDGRAPNSDDHDDDGGSHRHRLWEVSHDNFTASTPLGRKRFSNIVSRLTVGNASLGHLVLAAHFDSKLYKGIHFLGASDSAVPCVVLLELMKEISAVALAEAAEHPTLSTSRQLPRITVMFFDGEEAFVEWKGTDNTYGARHLAQEWQDSGELQTITMFVLLDLWGPPNPTFHNYFPQASGKEYARLNALEKELRRSGRALTRSPLPGAADTPRFFPTERRSPYGSIEDDHIPWLRRGVPVLHLIPAPFPSVWHNAGDNGDAIDYATTYDLFQIIREFTLTYNAQRGAARG